MIFLTALLVISIIGLVVLFGSKYIEEKTGKTFFLPVRIYDQDSEIREATRRAVSITKETSKHFMHKTWHASCIGCQKAWGYMKDRKSRRFEKPISNNGSGSVYLKQVMEHRNDARQRYTNGDN